MSYIFVAEEKYTWMGPAPPRICPDGFCDYTADITFMAKKLYFMNNINELGLGGLIKYMVGHCITHSKV